jgi:hypothetical protein
MHTVETMIVKYSMIGIRTFINRHVVIDIWRLQFMKTICHTSRLRIRKQCILMLLYLEMFWYWSPRTTHYWKNQSTHSTFYNSSIISVHQLYEWKVKFQQVTTLCFHFFENMHFRRTDQISFVLTCDRCTNISLSLSHSHKYTQLLLLLQAELVCYTILFVMPQHFELITRVPEIMSVPLKY